MSESPHSILRRHWGFHQFKGQQEQIILSVLAGNNVVAVLPTGAGKSICFQIPALLKKGICLVISPLIALMEDQVKNLKSKGIAAAMLHSGLDQRTKRLVLDNLHHNAYKFLYVAPERIQSPLFREHLANLDIAYVCIDEAHCIDQWGRDFRPSYQKIVELKSIIPTTQFVAFTATATSRVVRLIIDSLEISGASIFRENPIRKNLQIATCKVESKFVALIKAVKKYGGPGLIYVRNRKSTDQISRMLRLEGFEAAGYHAGMTMDARVEVQSKFLNSRLDFVVATTAFGMGIDKPDIRLIVHMDIPESLEAYVQEIGRAGRDGNTSISILYYQNADLERLKSNAIKMFLPLKVVKEIYQAVGNLFGLASGSGKLSRHTFEIEDITARIGFKENQLYRAVKVLEQCGYWRIIHVDDRSSVIFQVSKDVVHQYMVDHPGHKDVLTYLLRQHSGILYHRTAVSEYRISRALGIEVQEVVNLLNQITDRSIIAYKAKTNLPILEYLTERLPIRNLYIDSKWYEQKKDVVMKEMQSIFDYTQSQICRQRSIAAYFDHFDSKDCGICDNCQAKSNRSQRMSTNQILDVLERGSIALQDLEMQYQSSVFPELRQNLQWLLEQELIQIENGIIKRA